MLDLLTNRLLHSADLMKKDESFAPFSYSPGPRIYPIDLVVFVIHQAKKGGTFDGE